MPYRAQCVPGVAYGFTQCADVADKIDSRKVNLATELQELINRELQLNETLRDDKRQYSNLQISMTKSIEDKSVELVKELKKMNL